MAFASVIVFGVIEVRLYSVQVRDRRHYAKLARDQHNKTVTLDRHRGEILDRHLQVLACSTVYETIYYDPAKMNGPIPPLMVEKVARLLDMSETRVEAALGKGYVTPLKRKTPPEIAYGMQLLRKNLNLPRGAIFFRNESKRLYPQGDLAGPVIGFTTYDDGGDNVGLAGLELRHDLWLRGEEKRERVLVNNLRRGLAPIDEEKLSSTFGNSLVLTLDSQIQHYTQVALRRAVEKFEARSAVGLVMDVSTGEILAMANVPDFDPNHFSSAPASNRRNRVLTDPFEIGSVMKIITAAIFIDHNLLDPDELIDCHNGFAIIDGRRVTDSHALGLVSYREAFAESSNIAHASLGSRIEPGLYYVSLKKFGLGEKTGIELPGEDPGLLRPITRWSKLSMTSLPMGYETSLTALQVVTAIAAIGNGGVRMRPYIVKEVRGPGGRTVEKFSPIQAGVAAGAQTSRIVIDLMEQAVSHGTGEPAQMSGYRVAGKTGTTRKQGGGRRRYIASFGGLLPADNPRVAIFISVDEPEPKLGFYGSAVAAPAFAEVASHVVQILAIPPTEPFEISAIAQSSRQTLRGATSEADRSSTGQGEANRPIRRAVAGAQELRSPEPGSGDRWPPPPQSPTATEGSGSGMADSAMPETEGLTMSEVIERLARAGIAVRLSGSGLAVGQFPPAGVQVERGQVARVVFAAPSAAIKDARNTEVALIEP